MKRNKPSVINNAALTRLVHEHGKRTSAAFRFRVEEEVTRIVKETVKNTAHKTLQAIMLGLFACAMCITLEAKESKMMDKQLLSLAIEKRENGRYLWNDRDEFGPHQITLGLVRDYEWDTRRLGLTNGQIKAYAMTHYQQIVSWRLDKIMAHPVIQRLTCEQDAVKMAARMWKYGTRGALRGTTNDEYCVQVWNLYEKYQKEQEGK